MTLEQILKKKGERDSVIEFLVQRWEVATGGQIELSPDAIIDRNYVWDCLEYVLDEGLVSKESLDFFG